MHNTPFLRLQLWDLLTIDVIQIPDSFKTYLLAEFPDFCHDAKGAKNPDIQVQFVNSLSQKETKKISSFAEFDDENFYFTDGLGKRATTNFATYQKETWALTVEDGFHPKPLFLHLEHLLKLKALEKNYVFLHASGFSLLGKNIILTAWAHTGKTNTVLAALKNGADFIGDDFVIVTEKGVYAYPKRLNLFGYNFFEFPDLLASLTLLQRLQFFIESSLEKAIKPLVSIKSLGFLSNYLFEFYKLFSTKQHIRLPLTQVFKKSTVVSSAVPITKLFLMQRFSGNEIAFRETSAANIGQKMAHCLVFERAGIERLYRMYRFAYPQKTWSLLEHALEKEVQLLQDFLANVSCSEMSIPKKGNGTEIFDNIKQTTL